MIQKIFLVMCAILFNVTSSFAMHDDFVYLDEVDKTIVKSLRYLGKDNFLGRPVKGYKASRVILTKKAAVALSKAQSIFREKGYTIVVYDAYRPQTAVNDFMAWSKDPNDTIMKPYYYPRVDKDKVFELGYVAEKSGHSRGSTVDITLISLNRALHDVKPCTRKLNDELTVQFLDDGTEDMGTSFDLFDLASHYENNIISPEFQKKRTFLKEVMEESGFKNYAEEWWHFTLRDEPFPDTYFDFPVE